MKVGLLFEEQRLRLNILTLINGWTISFIVYVCRICIWSWGHTHYAMHVKAVELALSHLHVGSGAQTQ